MTTTATVTSSPITASVSGAAVSASVTSSTTSVSASGGVGPQGPAGDAGSGGSATLSSATPQPLGIASAGVALTAARGDHVHAAVAVANVTGLQAALDAKQAAGSYASASHTHAASDVSGLATVATSGSYNDLSNKPTIPAATTSASDLTSGTLSDARLSENVVLTTDSRLTNSRAPTAHASTHATGGSDAITPSSIGAAAASHTHSATDIASGTLNDARLSFTPLHPFLLMGG